MEDKLDTQPLLNKNNWFQQNDITNSPSITVFNTGAETRSGILNGIKVLVDLGNKKFVFFFENIVLYLVKKLSTMLIQPLPTMP